MRPRRSVLAAAVVTAVALAGTAGAAAPVLNAVGDIASCTSSGDEQTAALLATMPGSIAVLGDIVYENGTEDEFARCFDPSWGPLVPRIKAALGNHEYNSGSAKAAIARFGLPADGWYSYSVGAWHVIVLNSNCDRVGGCQVGSRQYRWLEADLAAHQNRCTLAYWHHPRFSSGIHGSDSRFNPFWSLLARAHADVVLQGHDHDYERFAPVQGIRSFVVGTGGRSLYPVLFPRPGSVVRSNANYGVLRLTLRPTNYTWAFVPVAGGTFRDSGSGRCR